MSSPELAREREDGRVVPRMNDGHMHLSKTTVRTGRRQAVAIEAVFAFYCESEAFCSLKIGMRHRSLAARDKKQHAPLNFPRGGEVQLGACSMRGL